MTNDPALYSSCMAGASWVDELRVMLERVGLREIRIRPKDESKTLIRDWAPGRHVEDYLVSATIEAIKPEG